MATRVHVLLARDAPVAAILRRGPTKQVRLLRWDLRTDEIEGGQWLAGRVYDHKCALSPDGELLVYFAMRKGHTWTAVSRTPYFTPLALWEESGTWGGGGFFTHNHRLLMSTNVRCLTLDPKFTLPERFVVEPAADHPEVTDDRGWSHHRPEADDTKTPSGKPRDQAHNGDYFSFRTRPRPDQASIVLEGHPVNVEDPYGPYTADDYVLRNTRTQAIEQLGVLDWADWDKNGDLLHAHDGIVYRTRMPTHERPKTTNALIDLTADRFAAMPPPPEAHRWPTSAMGPQRR